MQKYNIAVVGATGLVGETMIRVLEERKFPVAELRPLASEGSLGKHVKFCGREIPVQVLDKNSFEGIHFALFSAGGDISLEYAPIAAKAGAIVIDNTSAFRMAKDVPLIVPEVNGYVFARPRSGRGNLPNTVAFGGLPRASGAPAKRPAGGRNDKTSGFIIANPNCSTIQLVCVLKPIHDVAKIKRVVVSTYQSVSGAGREAVEYLKSGVAEGFSLPSIGGTLKGSATNFPHPFAFNCIPQIDKFEPNGYTKEEMKVVNETRKIMSAPEMNITCTAVRVPVQVGHSEAVNIETEKKLSTDDVRKILKKAPGVIVVDEPAKGKYPMPVDCVGKDEVFVGRIREDISIKNGLDLWIVADNLRKGAATNAVQIAELLTMGSDLSY